MKMQKPSQGEGFWVSSSKTPHREGGFETHTYRRQLISELVCMFQNPSPCGRFLIATLVCMYACVKSLTGRGVLKKPDRQRGFDKGSQAEGF